MSDKSPSEKPSNSTRRSFLKTSTAAVVGGSIASTLVAPRMAHAAGNDTIKIGIVGCGGRGTGAVINAFEADKNVKLTVMGDVFRDKLDFSRKTLLGNKKYGHQVAVDDDHCFSGFDAYKEVMKSDVDVVLLTTPPHFRPMHLKAAIEAGKHVFCEKPVAVDPTGVRSVLETVKLAKKKDLSIVSGLCWRYDLGVRETMKRIKDGEIGDITSIQENYLTGPLWHRGLRDSFKSDMEYQMRNWMYFTWLSGDHIVEQHIHSLDKALWLMDDESPKKCFGLGGRQVRTDPKWGHIYDHFAVCYEWANGVKTFAYTRQMQGCYRNVDDYVQGTKGSAIVLKHRVKGKSGKWAYSGPKPSMYKVEHQALYEGIRNGNPINNGEYMSKSTMMAIMGREACYTGKTITWDKAMKAKQNLSPDTYEWGDMPTPTVAVPGVTKFA